MSTEESTRLVYFCWGVLAGAGLACWAFVLHLLGWL